MSEKRTSPCVAVLLSRVELMLVTVGALPDYAENNPERKHVHGSHVAPSDLLCAWLPTAVSWNNQTLISWESSKEPHLRSLLFPLLVVFFKHICIGGMLLYWIPVLQEITNTQKKTKHIDQSTNSGWTVYITKGDDWIQNAHSSSGYHKYKRYKVHISS